MKEHYDFSLFQKGIASRCNIGINLLREGLDLPEVSLVATLDADKEGYLRSTDSERGSPKLEDPRWRKVGTARY